MGSWEKKMRKIIIKDWPYPDKVRAMLMRLGNPVCDGNGNWHTDVAFRSVSKEDKKIEMDWGLLPMLKTGQIFCDGYKISDNPNNKKDNFTFDNVNFRFFIDRIKRENSVIERPAFRARVGDIYYNIPAIEVVRSFFARARRLAYALLESNSILPLCQCQVETTTMKSAIVHLSPDCPSELTNEKWLPTLAWMATNELAQKSWDLFHRYFNSCNSEDIYPRNKEETPIFPMSGRFSIEGYYRSYGNTIWIEEIINMDGISLDFDEIVGVKHITKSNGKTKTGIVSVKKFEKIGITNSAQSATKGEVTVDVELPIFTFKKQPKIRIIKKNMGMGSIYANCSEKHEGSITVTGKNEGFIGVRTGIEFSARDEATNINKNDDIAMISIPGLKEAGAGDLQYNTTLSGYLDALSRLNKLQRISAVSTKIYELPGEGSLVWITAEGRRCCAISMVKLLTGKKIYIIEVDRTIYGSTRKKYIATLLLSIQGGECTEIIYKLVKLMAELGHWEEARLDALQDNLAYKRLKHGIGNERWVVRIYETMSFNFE